MPTYASVDGWEIRVDTSINNGCFALGVFDGNTALRIGLYGGQAALHFVVGDDDWKSLEEGKKYALDIQFGDESPWSGDAKGVRMGDAGAIFLWLQIDGLEKVSTFLKEFMEESNVDIRYRQKSIANLRLKSSFKAGEALLECQKLFNENREKQAPFENPNSREGDPFATPVKDQRDPFQ
jgi:hypothetical protein